jgi:putative peptidoglycan lipid II flippase
VTTPDAPTAAPGAARKGRALARNTAIFSVATGLSRVAGLAREVIAAAYFGTGAAASAFTLAFQVPNLIRALVADSALSAAFVPVFTELLEQGRRREAYELAGRLFGLILAVLGVVCVLFIAVAGLVIPPFARPEYADLAVGLSRVLFPILVLLGLNGLLVGILNAYDHFSIPAISPLVWNAVIVAGLIGLRPLFGPEHEIYAYAIGVLLGTLVQLLMVVPVLRRIGFPLRVSFAFRHDPRVAQILKLMLPVTLGLGLINFDLLINTVIGKEISDHAPAAIDRAFRLYMLPQGMFSVAVATVLFPALSRFAARRDLDGLRAAAANAIRLIALLLIPAAAATLVLAEPIVRLVYQRGEFDAQSTRQVTEALVWFSLSLPFAGANLMLTRTFFSLQRPWMPTLLAGASLVVNLAASLALYPSLGIAGPVIGTVLGSVAMTAGQAALLRRRLGGLELWETLDAVARMLAASVALALVAYGLWRGLDALLGRSLPAQVVAVGLALAAGAATYLAAVTALRVPEARQLTSLLSRRLGRSYPS